MQKQMHPLNVHEDSDVTSSDSDESVTDVTDDTMSLTSISTTSTSFARSKRQIAWCDVDTEQGEILPIQPLPPASTSVASPYVNVSLGRDWMAGVKMQLYCRIGHFLAIDPDGRVRGTQDKNDLHTILEMISIGHPGHVVIRGVLSNLFVSMTPKGRLRAQGNRNDESAVFLEGVLGFYMTYLSRHYAHHGWYLGIKKSGKFKNGRKTKMYQKAVHFLKQYRD